MKKEFICPSWNDFPDIYLYMDQAINVLDKYISPFSGEKSITSTMINNYVKQKIVEAPQNKKYSKESIARIFMVCILKSFMQLSDIGILLCAVGKGKTPEETFGIFKKEFDGAMKIVFDDGITEVNENDTDEIRTLRIALIAFAAILKAEEMFKEKSKSWKEPEQKNEK